MKKNKKLILAFIVAILITSGLIGGYFIVNKDLISLLNECVIVIIAEKC